MESFFIYLLKCGGIATLFFLVYTLLLKQETFFKHNRYFLLVGIVASLLLPLLIFTKIIYIAQPQFNVATINTGVAGNLLPYDAINWSSIFLFLYLGGVGVLFGRFMIQLLSLLQLINKSDIVKDGSFKMVATRETVTPFSFFNYIVYHPESYDNEELHTIIEHEKIHANQWHSIDIILTHLFTVFLWVHPLVWIYKKIITQNLEYIADGEAVRKVNCIKKYQYLLLNTSTNTYRMALANNFFNSLIKKRIVMLNRNKSQQKNMWKYGVILPLLAAFLLIFNVKTVAQVKVVEKVKKGKNHDTEMVHFSIDKNTTNDGLSKLKKEIKGEKGELSYKNLRRNADGEITSIKIEFRNGEGGFVTGNYNGDDEGIQPIVFGKSGKGGVFINSGHDHDSDMHFDEHSGHGVHVKSNSKHRVYVRTHSDDDDEHDNDDDDEDDEDDEDFIIIREGDANKNGGKKIKVRKIKKKGNSGHNVHIDGDSDGDFIVIRKGKRHGKEGKSGKKSYKIKKSGKHPDGQEGVLFLNTDDDADLLFIVDGKVSTKKKVEKLDTDAIEEIEVIKGDGAIEKYGKKAKDGVIKITTKKGE